MSWPAYDNATAYVTSQVLAVYPTAQVYADNSISILSWFEGTSVHVNSFFVSYEGFSTQGRENGTGPLRSLFSVYWHGRELNESVMLAIKDQVHANRTFTIDGRTHTASVTGGRYLLLDRGFDTYQLDIEIQ